jgi:hypothetical protein
VFLLGAVPLLDALGPYEVHSLHPKTPSLSQIDDDGWHRVGNGAAPKPTGAGETKEKGGKVPLGERGREAPES